MKQALYIAATLVILLVGAGLREFDLPSGALQEGEAAVLLGARLPLGAASVEAFCAGRPLLAAPLFRTWAALFEAGEVPARTLSMIAGLLAIAAVMALAARCFDPATALISGALMALCEPHVGYSRFALTVTAAVACTVCAAYFFLRVLTGGSRSWGFAYAAAAAGAVYLHPFAILVLPAFAWAARLQRSRARRTAARPYAVLSLILAIPAVVSTVYAFSNMNGFKPIVFNYGTFGWFFWQLNSRSSWIAPLAANLLVWGIFTRLRRSRYAIGASAGTGKWRAAAGDPNARRTYRLLLMLLAAPAAATVLLVPFTGSLFTIANYILLAPFYLILVGYGVRMLAPLSARLLLLTVLLALHAPPLQELYAARRASPLLRAVCRKVQEERGPADVIMHLSTASYSPCLVYRGRVPEEYFTGYSWQAPPGAEGANAVLDQAAAPRYERAWIVSYPKALTDEGLRELLQTPAFAARGAEVAALDDSRNVLLLRFSPRQQK